MCLTLAPAELKKTVVFASQVSINGKARHLLGYQNQPVSTAGANAMILPVPGCLSHDDLILTQDFPRILTDIALSLPNLYYRPLWSQPATFSISRAVVFEHGIYTVILAESALAIPEVYHLVPEEKRPPLKPAIFEAYAEWYPGWPILVCCFNNAAAEETHPLLLTYEPFFPDYLFMPGLDSHSGDLPDLSKRIPVEHSIAVAVEDMPKGLPDIYYRDQIPAAVRSLLPDNVIGIRCNLPYEMHNGDWYISIEEFHRHKRKAFLTSYRPEPHYDGVLPDLSYSKYMSFWLKRYPPGHRL